MRELARALNEAQAIADPGQRARALASLARQHDFAAAWWNLAATLLELGRTDEARAALLRSLALDAALREGLPSRLRALVEEPPEPSTPSVAPASPPPRAVSVPPPPAGTPPARPGPAQAATLVDPVESRIGRALGGDLRLDMLLHRSASQALYAASRPSGPVLVRQLLGLAPAAARRAFERERRAPAVSGCARVVDVVSDGDGVPLAVISPVRGELLADRLRAGPLSPSASIALVRGAAQILEELRQHDASVGDLHPEIVFFDEARESVTLLGATQSAASYGGGTMVASPARLRWAPPEEGLDGDGAASTEVYHLGLLLLACMVGGEVPDLGGRIGARWPDWLVRALEGRPAAWSRLRGAPAIDAILRRCLSPVPSERLATPAALSRALAEAVQLQPELRGRAGTVFDPVAGAPIGGAGQRGVAPARPVVAAPPRGDANGAGSVRLWAAVLGGAVALGVLLGGLIQLLRGG